MALKRIYLVKRSLYIYSARNFIPYLIWDVTLPIDLDAPIAQIWDLLV